MAEHRPVFHKKVRKLGDPAIHCVCGYTLGSVTPEGIEQEWRKHLATNQQRARHVVVESGSAGGLYRRVCSCGFVATGFGPKTLDQDWQTHIKREVHQFASARNDGYRYYYECTCGYGVNALTDDAAREAIQAHFGVNTNPDTELIASPINRVYLSDDEISTILRALGAYSAVGEEAERVQAITVTLAVETTPADPTLELIAALREITFGYSANRYPIMLALHAWYYKEKLVDSVALPIQRLYNALCAFDPDTSAQIVESN